VLDVEVEFYSFWYRLSLMLTLIALALSLAGIYAVMAYTVARRTREIGIRMALGADARGVALAILRRPLAQVLAGVLVGALILFGLMVSGWGASVKGAAYLGGYGLLMFGVCLLACIAPTRRVLRVQPTEAMRIEG
jgi:ABC-type antimicrobial peptide transport system permease subunit